MLVQISAALMLVTLSSGSIDFNEEKTRKKAYSSVIGLTTNCSADFLDVSLTMSSPFHGVLYARGFPLECRGKPAEGSRVSLRISTARCGVRLEHTDTGDVIYRAVIGVQLDRHLQQAADHLRRVECVRKAEKMVVKKSRSGRKMADKQDELRASLDDARSWLEIQGMDFPGGSRQVAVGELVSLVVKSRLPAGVESRVVDCSAHDGTTELQQKLLDERGCPLDDVIMPAFEYSRPKPGKHSLSGGLHAARAEFPAFKFPDRSALHVSCAVQLCRGACAAVDCEQPSNSTNQRANRNIKGVAGEVLERLVVYNSVEVLAPGIDTDEDAPPPRASAEYEGSPTVRSERAVCLSPNKMALAFGALGLVFLFGVGVAVLMLLHGRRRRRSCKHLLLSEDPMMSRDSPMLGPMLGLHPTAHHAGQPFVRLFH